MTCVVVLAGGPVLPGHLELPAGATVIAADSGADLAGMLGIEVDLLVGDLDSVSAETLARITRVERHRVDKDASDLELALTASLEFQPERIVVVGAEGGRLDHLFGVLLLLAADAYAGVQVDAQLGAAAVHVVRDERRLIGAPGELASLFAVHGPAVGVATSGLRYPLHGETLVPGSSRGISNEFADAHARITVEHGVLLAVRPNGSAVEGRPDRPLT
jgi:thiamine pyrophosphokinase